MTGLLILTIGISLRVLAADTAAGGRELGVELDCVWEHDRGQPDGELAPAERGGQQQVGVAWLGRGATGRRVDIALHQASSHTDTSGRKPPFCWAPPLGSVRSLAAGKSVHVCRLSSER